MPESSFNDIAELLARFRRDALANLSLFEKTINRVESVYCSGETEDVTDTDESSDLSKRVRRYISYTR